MAPAAGPTVMGIDVVTVATLLAAIATFAVLIAMFFGIDARYLGATVSGTENASITVWVTTAQLARR